jgi:hypothetical protein
VIERIKNFIVEEPDSSRQEFSKVWRYAISLNEDDAVRLRAFSSTNISNRFLIVIGHEAVSAPTVVAPLEFGSFLVETENEAVIRSVERALNHMRGKK